MIYLLIFTICLFAFVVKKMWDSYDVMRLNLEDQVAHWKGRYYKEASFLHAIQNSCATVHCNFDHPNDWTVTDEIVMGGPRIAYHGDTIREAIEKFIRKEDGHEIDDYGRSLNANEETL